ncbi:MAG: acylphosphatase [Deltaproteobacteria bacterium]|nr:MAG: acylphosphatase [Deltaproteobacteria bacterium]
MANIRAHLYVEGFVQGVFFRAETREEARRLGVTGWVRNLPDGRVEVVGEGEEGSVKGLVNWCHKGPSGARVSKVEVKYEQYRGEFDSFSVRYY